MVVELGAGRGGEGAAPRVEEGRGTGRRGRGSRRAWRRGIRSGRLVVASGTHSGMAEWEAWPRWGDGLWRGRCVEDRRRPTTGPAWMGRFVNGWPSG